MAVTMTPVKSSDIKMVGYDPKAGDLHVQFHSGPDTVVYHGVSPSTFHQFMSAKSKGKFHNENIKGTKDKPDKFFKWSKVPPVPPQL